MSPLPRGARARWRISKQCFGQKHERMTQIRIDQRMGDHHVEQLSLRRYTVPFEHAQVELEIVTNFFDALILELRSA